MDMMQESLLERSKKPSYSGSLSKPRSLSPLLRRKNELIVREAVVRDHSTFGIAKPSWMRELDWMNP
jgi:hypothetical protein